MNLQHRALGTTGLVLIALLVWASDRGRPGRAIISLVTALGRFTDRVFPTADERRRAPAGASRPSPAAPVES